MNTAPGVRGMGVEEAVVLEVRIGVPTHARGAGGGRLKANELAAPVQDEVVPGENGRITGSLSGTFLLQCRLALGTDDRNLMSLSSSKTCSR